MAAMTGTEDDGTETRCASWSSAVYGSVHQFVGHWRHQDQHMPQPGTAPSSYVLSGAFRRAQYVCCWSWPSFVGLLAEGSPPKAGPVRGAPGSSDGWLRCMHVGCGAQESR